MAASGGTLTWSTTSVTLAVGETITVNYTTTFSDVQSANFAPLIASVATFTEGTNKIDLTGTAAGTVTIAANTTVGFETVTTNALTITVTSADDQNFLNERGLAHFWENVDDVKQNKLTAGAGISITNDVISATGGGTADAVDWGHITGSMSNQTDLTTALNAKANSADLATVATSGDYDDLTDKPTIGNATLTIQKNGTSAGTFTANATSNKTINITVPTTAADVSALPASTKYGASIAVSINTTDYKVTTTLKDQDGNTLGTAQVIDLPLESVVVNGSYDNTNKKIVLTLQNGNTIDIPVADLVAGLQSEITSSNKLSSDLVDDTNHTHKFVTAAQITKLNGIASGAEVNVQADWTESNSSSDAYIQNKPSLATVATSGSYNDLSNKPTIPTVNNATLTIQKNGTTVKTFTANASSDVTANIIVPINVSELTNDAGYLTSVTWGDVTGKPTFATVATSGSYNDLSNKPTIPTATSELVNDSGFITSDTYVTQTLTAPYSFDVTYYPVASTALTTNTSTVTKFEAMRYNQHADSFYGSAELTLGRYDSLFLQGRLSLVSSQDSHGWKTTFCAPESSAGADQLIYAPVGVNTSLGGRLIASYSKGSATGSATNPVYADAQGILHATTYALNKTVPSDAVFTDTTYSDATTSAAGLMSAADKTKLNGIAAGAEVNVQSDWDQTTTTADDYIKNKPSLATVATSGSYNDLSDTPTIPTVNDATLTIQQNGTSLGTFTANASSSATVDVNAPKLTSLVGSVQTSDYHRSVVALCEVASGSGSTVNSWSSGKLVAHRNNGAYGVAEVDINIEAKRATAYYSNVSYFSNIALLSPTANINTDLGFRPCTFKYNNVYYAGIEFYISSSSASNVYFSGVGNFDVFGLDYYSVSHGSTASSVLNSEVYNSLNYTQWNEERNRWRVGRATRDIIYDNGSGTNANFSTTTAMSSYDDVEICYRDGNNNYALKLIPGPAGSFTLDIAHPGANNTVFWYISRYLVSGTNVTVGANNTRKAIGASSITTTATQDIYITRITGIRY